MTALDALARSAAASAIGQYGKAVVFRSVSQGAYDPATGLATQSTVDTSCRGVMDGTSKVKLGFRFGSDLIQEGDLGITIAAASIPSTPKPDDLVTIDGWDYVVVANQPTWSGDLIALHQLLVRK